MFSLKAKSNSQGTSRFKKVLQKCSDKNNKENYGYLHQYKEIVLIQLINQNLEAKLNNSRLVADNSLSTSQDKIETINLILNSALLKTSVILLLHISSQSKPKYKVNGKIIKY